MHEAKIFKRKRTANTVEIIYCYSIQALIMNGTMRLRTETFVSIAGLPHPGKVLNFYVVLENIWEVSRASPGQNSEATYPVVERGDWRVLQLAPSSHYLGLLIYMQCL